MRVRNNNQLESGVTVLTRLANRVYGWAEAAILKLNALKNKATICDSTEFIDRIPNDLTRIKVSGIPVPYVETARSLGVTPG